MIQFGIYAIDFWFSTDLQGLCAQIIVSNQATRCGQRSISMFDYETDLREK